MITSPVKRLKRLLTSGNLWLYILSITDSGRIYAYELDEKIEKEFGFRPDKIMNYVVLYKLENEGLITSEFQERRKYYKITKKGKQTLQQARQYFRTLAKRL